MKSLRPINVGLLGIGTVGGGTFEVLTRNQEEITRRAGRGIVIRTVADKDLKRARKLVGKSARVTDDAFKVVKRGGTVISLSGPPDRDFARREGAERAVLRQSRQRTEDAECQSNEHGRHADRKGDERPVDQQVLDVGCGTGRLLAFLHQAWPGLKWTGLDLSPPYLAEARRLIGDTARVKLIEGAAEKLPFEDASLDLVVSSFLLHELPAEIRGKALAEMARVLRPDGLVVVVDSIQRGDHAAWDGLLDLFPHYFHEPYYADYVGGRLTDWAADSGLAVVATERAFLSTVTALRRT